jgi:hypothetical protein
MGQSGKHDNVVMPCENPIMKPHTVVLAALASASLLAFAQPSGKLDSSWFKSGQDPQKYDIGLEHNGVRRGNAAKFLRAKPEADDGSWASLMQVFSARDYRGKRLRFEAQVRTEDVSNWAGLWMRVDDANGPVAFYNSQDKPIKGTTGWQLRSVTLDVPSDAKEIAFGAIGEGKGTIWLDELKMELVGNDVPVDTMPMNESTVSRSKPSL